jgi:hypothetical protein
LAAESSSLFTTPWVAWAAIAGDNEVEPMKPIAAIMAINLRMCVVLMVLFGILGADVSEARSVSNASLPFTARLSLQNSFRLAN